MSMPRRAAPVHVDRANLPQNQDAEKRSLFFARRVENLREARTRAAFVI